MTYRAHLTVVLAAVAAFAGATAGQAEAKSKFRNGVMGVGLQQPKKQVVRPVQRFDNATFWEMMARKS
jgi:hypothetical protein